MKNFKEFLNEATVSSSSMKVDDMPKQTPGKPALNRQGKEVPHSIALNETDVAYVSGNEIVIMTADAISGKVSNVKIPKDEFKLLKKIG